MTFFCLIFYVLIVVLLNRLPERAFCWADFSGILPHGAAAGARARVLPVSIAWAGVFLLLLVVTRFLAKDFVDGAASAASLVAMLILGLAIFSLYHTAALYSSAPADDGQESPEDVVLRRAQYLLIVGTPFQIVQIVGDPQLGIAVERTPYDGVAVSTVDFLDIIREKHPGVRLYPWDESLQAMFVDPHAASIEIANEKVAEAISASSDLAFTKGELEATSAALAETRTANQKLDKILHDLRARQGGGGGIDPARMTLQQAQEEFRRLSERIKLVELRVANGEKGGAPIFQQKISLGS